MSSRSRSCCRVAFIQTLTLFAVAAASAGSDEATPRNAPAVADVEAGRVETARASWWGFDPEDATLSLQAAFNSPAKRVIVEKMGRPWIVKPIQLPSDKEIIFESGVVVEAKRGAFLGKGDSLFVASACKHLTLRGAGATFRMHKSDYHKPPYQPAEWRHALSLRGCEDVTVEGLTLADSGGDGIYLGVGPNKATNRNITIRNVDCNGNNRQGISVITAENLLIENCQFRNTQGTAPEAGIDFEPNAPNERLVNCVLRNCRSEDNAGHAYHLYLGNMHDQSPPISIRFENCTSAGCQRYSTYVGVANRNGERTVRGSIEYVQCRFNADRGAGVYIRGNEADGCKIRFDRCEIVRRDGPESTIAPITIVAPRQLDVDAGNVDILDCVIRDSLDRQPIALSASPLTGLRNISGSLTVESPGHKTTYALDAKQLQTWFPTQGLIARIPRLSFDWRESQSLAAEASDTHSSGAAWRLRHTAALIVWAQEGQPVELTVAMEGVGRHTPQAGPIELTSPNGEAKKLVPATDDKHVIYTFTPRVSGPHRLDWQGDNNATLRPVDCSAPYALLGDRLGLGLIRPTGKLRFAVPSGVKRFAVVVAGAGTAESVKATIRNAAGNMVAEQDNITAPHVFLLEADGHETKELWSVTLARASEGVLEDVSVMAVGIPPLFAAGSAD